MTTLSTNTVFSSIDLPRAAVTVVTAGAFATLAFDFFGQSLSPWLGYSRLAPVPLANGVIAKVFGQGVQPAAVALHYFIGMVAYAFGWVAIVEPLRKRFTPQLPWALAAVAYGVALWVWALYVVAHLVVGNAPFLGFSQITWVALAGHVIYAVVAAGVAKARDV